MPDGSDWLFRPAISSPPLCTIKDLYDGTYDLADVALMNELLDVRDHNNYLANKAANETNNG